MENFLLKNDRLKKCWSLDYKERLFFQDNYKGFEFVVDFELPRSCGAVLILYQIYPQLST